MQVKLIAKSVICNEELLNELKTNSPEALVMYCARVSNPSSQTGGNPKLLKYCLDHGHVSIFEMADMVVEITTSRGIAAQILRHRSFTFQEFSQRYAEATGFEMYPPRRQDNKNRQNSVDDMPVEAKLWFEDAQKMIQAESMRLYKKALDIGVAKEQARFLLPLSTETKLYMKGSLRSWIHYLKVRTDESTQKEHRDIAEEIKKIFIKEYPVISNSLSWA